MRFGLFFSRNQTVLQLPIHPERLPVIRESENQECNVLEIGPVLLPRTPKQKVITISSYFPGRPMPGVWGSGERYEPEVYIRFFESAMEDKAPIRYTPARYYENGQPFFTGDTGFLALVTRFDTEERGGETGDFYYDLTLTEYRSYAPKTLQTGTQEAEPTVSRDVPNGQLYVGAICIANGPYYYTSYGAEPHGNGRGRRVKIVRIVEASRACPILIQTESGGILGWSAASSLQVVQT